uniref:Magnesium transporter n=1 Tax=Leersia perrieri TaxID=77586 RepID=A0A0D9W513_9ORYZ
MAELGELALTSSPPRWGAVCRFPLSRHLFAARKPASPGPRVATPPHHSRPHATYARCLRARAVITTSEVLVPCPRDPAVAPLLRDLHARLASAAAPSSPPPPPPKDGSNGGGDEKGADLPFEFVALEVCLDFACKSLQHETSTLEKEAYPALDELTSKVSTLNLERVRQIKSRLVAISGRVQKVRDELEHLLDDDMDMAALHLTEKLAYYQSAGHREEEVEEDGETLTGGSFRPNTEELEILLESYFVQIDGTLNKLSTLREYVDDTEDYINMMLDEKQNQLLQMGILMSTATLVISGATVVTGVLGINIRIPLYETPADTSVFWYAVAGIGGSGLALYLTAIICYKRTGILQTKLSLDLSSSSRCAVAGDYLRPGCLAPWHLRSSSACTCAGDAASWGRGESIAGGKWEWASVTAASSGGARASPEAVGTKQQLMRRTGLPPRDLRALSSASCPPAAIVARERAVVVNVERARAVITASEVLVPCPRDPAVAPLLRDLRARLATSTSTVPPPMKDGEGIIGKDGDEKGAHLPFEFAALETSTLEKVAYPALDELTSIVSTLNLERVRQIKSRLVAISGRVQKVRDELEHLLDDEMDMAALHLTEKLAYYQSSAGQSTRFDIEKEANELEDHRFHCGIKMNKPYTTNSCSESSSMDEEVEENGETLTGVSFRPNIEGLEILLESYFVQIDGTLNKLSTVSPSSPF